MSNPKRSRSFVFQLTMVRGPAPSGWSLGISSSGILGAELDLGGGGVGADRRDAGPRHVGGADAIGQGAATARLTRRGAPNLGPDPVSVAAHAALRWLQRVSRCLAPRYPGGTVIGSYTPHAAVAQDAEGSSPSDPASSMPRRSECRPNMFSVSRTSKCRGLRSRCMAAASPAVLERYARELVFDHALATSRRDEVYARWPCRPRRCDRRARAPAARYPLSPRRFPRSCSCRRPRLRAPCGSCVRNRWPPVNSRTTMMVDALDHLGMRAKHPVRWQGPHRVRSVREQTEHASQLEAGPVQAVFAATALTIAARRPRQAAPLRPPAGRPGCGGSADPDESIAAPPISGSTNSSSWPNDRPPRAGLAPLRPSPLARCRSAQTAMRTFIRPLARSARWHALPSQIVELVEPFSRQWREKASMGKATAEPLAGAGTWPEVDLDLGPRCSTEPRCVSSSHVRQQAFFNLLLRKMSAISVLSTARRRSRAAPGSVLARRPHNRSSGRRRDRQPRACDGSARTRAGLPSRRNASPRTARHRDPRGSWS